MKDSGLTILADKGYDSDHFVKKIIDNGAIPVIPSRKNRKQARGYDRVLYKECNLVERLFQKLKHFRRIATRYERLARNYQAMLHFMTTHLGLTIFQSDPNASKLSANLLKIPAFWD